MKNTRKKSIALAAGLAITGLVSASAASLGVVGSDTLGAGGDEVATCDNDGVTVDYSTAYVIDATTPYYRVSEVVMNGVNVLCANLAYKVTLAGAAGASLRQETGVIPDLSVGPATTFSFLVGGSIDAEDVLDVAIVITG